MTITYSPPGGKATNKPTPTKHVIHSKPHEKPEEKKGTKHTGHPEVHPHRQKLSPEEENRLLRARVKILSDQLKQVRRVADEQIRLSFALVWFARNNDIFPDDEIIRHIRQSPEFSPSVQQLVGLQSEYWTGFNTGLLAASRMFKDVSTPPKVSEETEDKMQISSLWEETVLGISSRQAEQIEASKRAFPDTTTNGVPQLGRNPLA